MTTDEGSLDQIKALIADLRNAREPDHRWAHFTTLVEGRLDCILATFPLRWLIAICDSYADYGDEVQSRNAMLISTFHVMLRLAETTRYVRPAVDPARLAQLGSGRIELFEEVHTIHLNRQDVMLNLHRRLAGALDGDPVLGSVWSEIRRRLERADTVLAEFAHGSAMPERWFPPDPLGQEDNHGVSRRAFEAARRDPDQPIRSRSARQASA
jgi:hypothetical protein